MRRHPLSAALALACSIGFAFPALAAENLAAASKAVWDRHVQAAVAGDIDEVMEDFAEDSVIITPERVIAGKPAIRAFFVEFLAVAEESGGSPTVNHEIVHDNIVVFNFTDAMKENTYHDTAVIDDGKIRVISTIGYPTE